MSHDIFISYSSEDKPIADAVCATLESKHGLRCWVAPRDIIPGTDWAESIIDAITGCQVMVLIFSDHANQSSHVEKEVERAVNKGIPIIPFRIEDVSPNKALEFFISTPHWLDAITTPLERHISNLAEILHVMLDKNRSSKEIPDHDTISDQAKDALSDSLDELPSPPKKPFRLKPNAVLFICVIGLVLAVAAASVLNLTNRNSKITNYVEKADKMVAAGEFAGAIELHDKILAVQPGNISVLLSRAFSNLYIGRYEKARNDCDRILKIDNNNTKALGIRSLSKSLQYDLSGAVKDGTSAVKIDPKCLFGYIGRGTALRVKGQIEAGLKDAQKALELVPDSAWANAAYSCILPVSKNADLKLETAEKAVALDMNLWFAYIVRAMCYFELGEYEKSIFDAGEALRLSPRNPWGYVVNALSYTSLGEIEQVIETGKEAFNAKHDDVAALVAYWLGLLHSKDLETALDCSNRIVAKAPDYYAGYSLRSIVLAAKGNHEKAIQDANKGVLLNGRLDEPYFFRALVKKNIQDYSGALNDYNTAIRLNPIGHQNYQGRGQLYYEFDQPENALADYSEAIRLNPYNEEYLIERAALYKQLGQLENAKFDLYKAEEGSKNDPRIWELLSQIDYELKDWDAAIKDATNAILLDPNPAYRYNRGKVFLKKELITEALDDFYHACTKEPDHADFCLTFYRTSLEKAASHPELILDFFNKLKEDDISPKFKYAYHFILGFCKMNLLQVEIAIEDFNKAIELNGNDYSLYHCRSRCRFLNSQLDLAFEDAQAALNLLPEFQEAMLMKAKINFCKGQIDEAIMDANRILDLEEKTEHWSACMALSLIYRVKGDLDAAESYWQKAVGPESKYRKGVIVIEVHKGSAAKKCGIQAKDRLFFYDGVALWSSLDLQFLTQRKGKNKRILTIEREKKSIEYLVPEGRLGITMNQISD